MHANRRPSMSEYNPLYDEAVNQTPLVEVGHIQCFCDNVQNGIYTGKHDNDCDVMREAEDD
jgi:hypothetical protein